MRRALLKVIGAVLLGGAAAASINSRWARAAGLIAQGFALVGTLVGITTIAMGIDTSAFVPSCIFVTFVGLCFPALRLCGPASKGAKSGLAILRSL